MFAYHDAFNDDLGEVKDLKARYRAGRVGDVEVKRKLAAALNRFMEPMREQQSAYEGKSQLIDQIIGDGTERYRTGLAADTLRMVRDGVVRVRSALARLRNLPGVRTSVARGHLFTITR